LGLNKGGAYAKMKKKGLLHDSGGRKGDFSRGRTGKDCGKNENQVAGVRL